LLKKMSPLDFPVWAVRARLLHDGSTRRWRSAIAALTAQTGKYIMDAATYDVAGLNGATQNAPRRKGFFDHLLHALHETQARRAHRVIVAYAHLLADAQDATHSTPHRD
jgi:hypothetical protein